MYLISPIGNRFIRKAKAIETLRDYHLMTKPIQKCYPIFKTGLVMRDEWRSSSGGCISTMTDLSAGAFLVTDNRVYKEPLDRSLCSFARTAHSLRSAPLCYARLARSLAPFTGSLTHFAHSLVGQLKFLNMCSRCYHVSRVQTRCLSSLKTRPQSM